MSQRLISRSPDLQRLIDEGYDVRIVGGVYLVIGHVPYVRATKEVAYGTLVATLQLAADATVRPGDHVVKFAGEHPCNSDGSKMRSIEHAALQETVAGVTVAHSFSRKPASGYTDYHHMMTTYIAIISEPARALDPTATAITHSVVVVDDVDSVFQYYDNAASRAGITEVAKKLELSKVAVIGVGGTGAYVLDLIAKTGVKEIHLFDGDRFLQHNAFRSPGAPSRDELEGGPLKAEYFAKKYSQMHRHVYPHAQYVDESNVGELTDMAFAFLCLDNGRTKKIIIDKLMAVGVPFIDVGMGVYLTNGALGGVLRTTTFSKEKGDHILAGSRIPVTDADPNNEYIKNIQIADLNALNAALAVVKWKKLFGYYHDFEHEHFSAYTIDGNMLTNDDLP